MQRGFMEMDKDYRANGEPPMCATHGGGPLFSDPDPDAARTFFANKPRAETDKRMGPKEVVERFITDGCYLAIGGFGANRTMVRLKMCT